MTPATYLFVYGTLKSGFNNPFSKKLNESSSFLGRGFFFGEMFKVSWYPAVVEHASNKVIGEVFEITNPDIFVELDEYEGDIYQRVPQSITLENGKELTCWIYLYIENVTDLERIHSGEWR